MGTVLGTLGKLGYWWTYRCVDAQYFGLAQRRKRVFIVGCFGDGRSAAEVLLEPESLCGDSAPSRETGARVAQCLSPSITGRSDSTGGKNGGRPVNLVAAPLTQHPYADNEAQDDKLVVGKGDSAQCVAFQSKQSSTSQGPSFDEVSPSLDVAKAGGMSTQIGMTVRRLTPVECCRLQGFPDDWLDVEYKGKPLSDSARYRMLGNAVAVPVAEWIGKRILEAG